MYDINRIWFEPSLFKGTAKGCWFGILILISMCMTLCWFGTYLVLNIPLILQVSYSFDFKFSILLFADF